jgi:hypothetical protein
MQTVPLQSVPAQTIKTTLDSQTVELDIYTRRYGMFMDIYVNGVLEIGGVICQNLNRIIRSAYLNRNVGFAGDFVWNDSQGSTDPVFTGLGSRYQLFYLSADDLAALGISG